MAALHGSYASDRNQFRGWGNLASNVEVLPTNSQQRDANSAIDFSAEKNWRRSSDQCRVLTL